MKRVRFVGNVSLSGKDEFGKPRYAIHIPKCMNRKIRKFLGKKVIVTVKLPEDEIEIEEFELKCE